LNRSDQTVETRSMHGRKREICITILLGNVKYRVCLWEQNVDEKATLNVIFYKPYVDMWSGFNLPKILG